MNAFDFIAPAPAHHLLPSDKPEDILGVTVIIIAAAYRDKEFVRVGYYVNTYYEDEEMMENPGERVIWDKLHRNVLIEKPKVTRLVAVSSPPPNLTQPLPRSVIIWLIHSDSPTRGIRGHKRATTDLSTSNRHRACRPTCSSPHPRPRQ